jgi:DNA-binding transcriptional MerR regulator
VAREWTVGELAHQAGVSVRTLHHYDEIGLLRPTRTAAGHRRSTEPDVARFTQVVALRSVGLSLGEIRRCLESGEALAGTLTRQLRDLERVARRASPIAG